MRCIDRVNACSCRTELISAYLDSVFSPLVQELLNYIRNPSHALHLLQDFQFPGHNTSSSLWSSNPSTLVSLDFFLSHRPNQSRSTNTLIRLTKLVLTLNNFFFNSSHFLQIKGVSMGTRMSPSYACFFVGYMEQTLFWCYTGTIPHLFLRYINDCISAASCSHEEIEQFINFTNTFHPNLKFTWTISKASLSFVDLSVSISDDRLETGIYFKPTDSHSYLDYTSSHPPSCKNVIHHSQFLHLCRVCSQVGAFHSCIFQMSSYFKDLNFPPP
eukprot:g21207.t1